MSDDAIDWKDLDRRMEGAVSVFHSEAAGLRTGRASASLIEPIYVEAYGSKMPMAQVGTISVPESRMISVQVWDQSLVTAVDKAIRESSLNLNPVVEGTLLRIPIPELNAERREELVKVAHKYAEQAKVAVRHVRRDGMEKLKRLEKDGVVSQDEARHQGERIQKMTDKAIDEIEKALASKEKEITQV